MKHHLQVVEPEATLAVSTELEWIEEMATKIRGGVAQLADCASEREHDEAEELARDILEDADLLVSRTRAISCLLEAVEAAGCHTAESHDCALLAQMAHRAMYISDIGYAHHN